MLLVEHLPRQTICSGSLAERSLQLPAHEVVLLIERRARTTGRPLPGSRQELATPKRNPHGGGQQERRTIERDSIQEAGGQRVPTAFGEAGEHAQAVPKQAAQATQASWFRPPSR